MRANIVRIGNSRGIRIPKTVLEECGLGQQVELEVHRHFLAVRPVGKPRTGWEEAFKRMHAEGDDRLVQEGLSSAWDQQDWAW